ncbi:MAG: hypothetical protein JXK05_09700 [Campylobacterales bacterium]|nr:hypothetical protein [Campylobacterales bacterium]
MRHILSALLLSTLSLPSADWSGIDWVTSVGASIAIDKWHDNGAIRQIDYTNYITSSDRHVHLSIAMQGKVPALSEHISLELGPRVAIEPHVIGVSIYARLGLHIPSHAPVMGGWVFFAGGSHGMGDDDGKAQTERATFTGITGAKETVDFRSRGGKVFIASGAEAGVQIPITSTLQMECGFSRLGRLHKHQVSPSSIPTDPIQAMRVVTGKGTDTAHTRDYLSLSLRYSF